MTKEVKKIISELKNKSNENTRRIYINHGASEKCLGVKFDALKITSKKYKHLSIEDIKEMLESDIMELQVLSTYILKNSKRYDLITTNFLNKAISSSNNYMFFEFVIGDIIGESNNLEIIKDWLKDKSDDGKFSSAITGYIIILKNTKVDPLKLNNKIYKWIKNINSFQNRSKYVLNNLLIAFGIYILQEKERAYEQSKVIPKFNVYMGKTSCKIPNAKEKIEKYFERKKR